MPLQTAEVLDVEVAVPVVNDSSEGLARMLNDLAPLAARLRANATILLLFSVLFMGSLEGMFGMIAAIGLLCCAAPGPLGAAAAARCTRIMATVCATFALMHILCLSFFAVAVLPEMPHAFHHACAEAHHPPLADKMALAAPAHQQAPPEGPAHFVGHLVVRTFVAAPHHEEGAPENISQGPRPSAMFFATVATTAHRRLQEFAYGEPADMDEPSCLKTERLFAQAAPVFLVAAIFVELGLFIAAINTAKAAARLVYTARKSGANGI